MCKKIFEILWNLLQVSGKILSFAAQNTGVAQLVEHWSPKPGVGSSSLSSRAYDAIFLG